MDDALRAESIFFLLKELRAYCLRYPDYNVAVNLNGMNGCVDVKVFKDNACVLSLLDVDSALHEMLDKAHNYMLDERGPLVVPVVTAATRDARVVWMNYATCARCGAVMGSPCLRLDMPNQQMSKPHIGRIRFRGDRRAERNSAV